MPFDYRSSNSVLFLVSQDQTSGQDHCGEPQQSSGGRKELADHQSRHASVQSSNVIPNLKREPRLLPYNPNQGRTQPDHTQLPSSRDQVTQSSDCVKESTALSWLEQSVNTREDTGYLANLNHLLSTTCLPNASSASSFTPAKTESDTPELTNTASNSFLFDNLTAQQPSTSSVVMSNLVPKVLSPPTYFNTSMMGLSSPLHYHEEFIPGEFTCTVCSKSFAQKCLLKRHMKIHATGEKCHCHFCNFETTFKFNLKSHMARMHKHICNEDCSFYNTTN